jgi:hypothetical protein
MGRLTLPHSKICPRTNGRPVQTECTNSLAET